MRSAWKLLPVLVGLALGGAPGAAQQGAQAPRDAARCGLCHGELELLRQQTATPQRARELLVPPAVVRESAHGELECAACHTGYAVFPHPEARTATESCVGCHAAADSAWSAGVHAHVPEAGSAPAADCAGCHGVHDVVPAEGLSEGAGMVAMNDRCSSCHQAVDLPPGDPHAGAVACAACHAAHDVRSVESAASAVAPGNLAETCGGCHAEPLARWREDAHGAAVGAALADQDGARAGPTEERTPTCTACHGAHGMVAVGDPGFAAGSVDICAECHEHAASTFFGSYHGKATALGSRVSATCHDCHRAHGVYPAASPQSSVAERNLVQTCGQCHEHARPAFVRYDSHPDPFDRDRNPWIFYSFWFMNALLVGVLGVFGLHTLLWWVRLSIDRRRGVGHGHGGEA